MSQRMECKKGRKRGSAKEEDVWERVKKTMSGKKNFYRLPKKGFFLRNQSYSFVSGMDSKKKAFR